MTSDVGDRRRASPLGTRRPLSSTTPRCYTYHRDASQRKVPLTSSQPRLSGTAAPNRVTGSWVHHIASRGPGSPLWSAAVPDQTGMRLGEEVIEVTQRTFRNGQPRLSW